jgi:carbonic anhydrase/acetyltransferase-like protein (isoleucine patch superfamily)
VIVNAHLLPTGTRIEPFLDPIGESPVANHPLEWWQRRACEACGLVLQTPEVPVRGPCVVLADDLFVTRGLLRAFLDALGTDPPREPRVLRVEGSAQLAQAAPLQGLTVVAAGPDRASASFPLWYLPPGWEGLPSAVDEIPPVAVTPREKLLRIPVPEHYFGSPELLVPLSMQVVMRLRHWTHLLQVNRVAWALEWLDRPGWRQALTLAWAVIRAGIPTRTRLLRTLSRVGRGCEIHPTAVLEGAILEDGVRVGPFCVVRFSRVGRASWLQDHAQVTLSVLGERTMVSASSTVNLCLTWPEAAASQILMQLSVLGRRSITTGGGFMMDMRFDRNVRVLHEGRAQDSGTRFLGSAVGHGAILGTGFWLAPGRAIPNGAVVVRPPDQVVREIPREVADGTLLAPVQGRLVPLEGGGTASDPRAVVAGTDAGEGV